MDGLKGSFGVTETLDNGGDVVEAELDPELLEAKQIGKRIDHLDLRRLLSRSGVLRDQLARAARRFVAHGNRDRPPRVHEAQCVADGGFKFSPVDNQIE